MGEGSSERHQELEDSVRRLQVAPEMEVLDGSRAVMMRPFSFSGSYGLLVVRSMPWSLGSIGSLMLVLELLLVSRRVHGM